MFLLQEQLEAIMHSTSHAYCLWRVYSLEKEVMYGGESEVLLFLI